MAITHVKKGDRVIILSGKDKGKRGKVIQALPQEGKVVVEGINVVKRHMKPRGTKRLSQAGIIEKPAALSNSKVMLVCPKCDTPTRAKRQILEDSKKAVRVCRRCGEIIDTM